MYFIFTPYNDKHIIKKIIFIERRVYKILSFYYIRAIILIVSNMSFTDTKYCFTIFVIPFDLGFCTTVNILPIGFYSFIFLCQENI